MEKRGLPPKRPDEADEMMAVLGFVGPGDQAGQAAPWPVRLFSNFKGNGCAWQDLNRVQGRWVAAHRCRSIPALTRKWKGSVVWRCDAPDRETQTKAPKAVRDVCSQARQGSGG